MSAQAIGQDEWSVPLVQRETGVASLTGRTCGTVNETCQAIRDVSHAARRSVDLSTGQVVKSSVSCAHVFVQLTIQQSDQSIRLPAALCAVALLFALGFPQLPIDHCLIDFL